MISLPSKPKIVKKEKNNEAVFEIDSLYPGYGVTIGNSIRRVLLSSLGGAAVTKVKITDVNHEFSTIPGVMEDVIAIILNLKELRFRIYSDESQIAKLKVKGEMDVKGSHFEVPTQIELVNPDVHIATLTDKKALLEMEIEIEKGMGYSSAEDRKEEKLEVGQIIIDSIFTPVKRVNFYVENMRVGKRTDYDRLFIEIETDKTISPEEAFFQAVGILRNHFEKFSSFEEEKEELLEEKPKEEENINEELSVDEIGISVRTVNILKENNIKKVKQLIKKRESAISELSGMGEKGIEDIKKALKKIKLQLKEEK